MARIIRTIGASIGVTVCFFYLGCGSIQVANASGGANSAPLTIATKLLPSAVAGSPYVVVLDATGGTPGYTWSITAGKLPSGVSLTPTSGIISGTPTVTGNFSVGVTLNDQSIPSQTRTSSITISVAPPPLAVAASALPSATYGTPYAQTLRATGGQPSYAWSITSGTLPAGLTLASSSGVISGTPSAVGSSSFGVTVRDNQRPSQSQSVAMNISVAPTSLKIMTTALPSAVGGTNYSQVLQASGGTPGYKWAIASGSLPAGLSLAQTTGAITGIPTSNGTSTFTAAVSDSSSPAPAISAPIAIVVASARLAIATPVLPSVTIATPYSQSLRVTGGTGPYAWTITSGQLPAGLTLGSAGAITGTPTVSGAATFVATVTDRSSPVQSASVSTKVVVTPTQLTVMPSALPAVRVGATYSHALQASGGTTPYRWSIASGNLPAGLSLAASTGTISGTPTSSGTATFTAAVTDSGSPTQSAASTTAVVVAPIPLIITSSTIPSATAGTGYSQTMQAIGGSAPYTWSITSGKLPTGLTLTPSTGAISGTPTVSGPFSFTTTVTDNSNPAQTASATTEVSVAGTTLAITTQSLPAISSGRGYSQTLTATGGSAPYTWSITSGQLPGGLAISSSGLISGTPTSSVSSSFTVTVADSSSPAQTRSAEMTITGTGNPLSITSKSMSPGTDGTPYSQALQASGGTPAYTWSITSGSLPAGLTLAATTGTISGTPTTSGTSNFTATVADNGSPVQQQSAATSITISSTQAIVGPGATWFVRTDGGTRYSANVPSGQCDGKADVAYPGSGVNQHCAFKDFRYMWDDGSYGNYAWVISGGDTVVIRGCSAASDQQNASNPTCRIGWDTATGSGSAGWCAGSQPNTNCFNPTIPQGSSAAHTRILGGCAYDGTCNPVNTYPYTSNLTQLFGGFGAGTVLSVAATSYVDVAGLEITSHNGACSRLGIPRWPADCSTSSPISDFVSQGISTNNTSANITFQDLYVHGANSSGFYGAIGGPITMTRVISNFNTFAGWNLDDGTPDGAGSSITASYVWMEGNGCLEEYPIVHTSYPAKSCWDTTSAGFGDSWSGQNANMDAFSCDHCTTIYNTKDGFIGPHTLIKNLSLTRSSWYGNMGSQLKWGTQANGSTLFQNNFVNGNCYAMSIQIPGAGQNFNITTGLNGSYLGGWCRAAGSPFAISTSANSTFLFAGNTIVSSIGATTLQMSAVATPIATTTWQYTDNIFLGYSVPGGYGPYGGGYTPAIYYTDDSLGAADVIVHSDHNLFYGNRTDDCTGGYGGVTLTSTSPVCSNPLLTGQPSSYSGESGFIPFIPSTKNLYSTSMSPAVAAGVAVSGMTSDYYGVTRPNPPSIGAVEP